MQRNHNYTYSHNQKQMILARRTSGILMNKGYSFGSYYNMVKFFSEVQALSGSKEKLARIREFRASLAEEDRQEFNSLMGWYARKEPIRITAKVLNKHYLNKYVPPSQHSIVEPELAEGGIMKRLSKIDQESQLTIYDVKLFLRYLCALQGTGSQTQKAEKIMSFGQNVSVLEGIFLLKLIERRLTIGAGNKTFRKADRLVQSQTHSQSIQEPKKTKKKKQKVQTQNLSELEQ